jgi:hypothetical protein
VPQFRLPRWDEHLAVIGQNGSGKTRLATWALSHAHFDRIPYVIIDYKREQLFERIEGIQLLGAFRGRPPWKAPKRPGLYIVQPNPDEEEEIEKFLYSVWRKGRCGLYLDEGLQLPNQRNGAFQALLTQGRSKRIPMIVLVQRPSLVSRFIFSEAKYISVFRLIDRRDQQTVEGFAPIDFEKKLEPYWSQWYDTGQDHTFLLQPVPSDDTIVSTIDQRLPRRW